MFAREKIELLDQPPNLILQKLRHSIKGQDVHFLNSYNIGLAVLNPRYRDLLTKSKINLIDGLILLRILQIWKILRLKNQIRGVDFLRACLLSSMDGAPAFKKHCFVGSTADVLTALERKCYEINSQISATFISLPFLELEEMNLLELSSDISKFRPDIIWIGLGTPKQDYVAHYLSQKLNTHVIAVGAAFDFLSGNRAESSIRMRKLGLEWLTRLVEEPKRLWRRYILVSPLSLLYPFFISIRIRQHK